MLSRVAIQERLGDTRGVGLRLSFACDGARGPPVTIITAVVAISLAALTHPTAADTATSSESVSAGASSGTATA